MANSGVSRLTVDWPDTPKRPESPELEAWEPEEKLEPPVAPENLEELSPDDLEEPSPDEELVKPVAPENLEDGTETDLEEDPIPMEEMACWMAGVSWDSTCPT